MRLRGRDGRKHRVGKGRGGGERGRDQVGKRRERGRERETGREDRVNQQVMFQATPASLSMLGEELALDSALGGSCIAAPYPCASSNWGEVHEALNPNPRCCLLPSP